MYHICDVYFYCELLRSIGSKESDEWLKACALKKKEIYVVAASERSPSKEPLRSVNSTMTSAEPNIENEHWAVCNLLLPKECLESEKPVDEAKDRNLQSVDSNVNCCQEDHIPSEPYSFSDSQKNLGLLFTDAAHIVLNKPITSRSARIIRKFKSSLF
jgi:hypothetical protein